MTMNSSAREEGGIVMRGRKSPLVITLTDDEKTGLETILRRTTVEAGLARRAKIILLLAETHSISGTARAVQDQRSVVRLWGRRYQEKRFRGLFDEPRSGRPPVFFPRGCGLPREAGLRDAGDQRGAGIAVGLRGAGEEAGR